MGIGMPLVGYVAATAHGAKPTENKRVEVDSFMGLVRIAYQDGWAAGLVPSGVNISQLSKGATIPEKNFEHRIFVDYDLENRPQLLAAIDFLNSEPAGGSLCVISIDDIKTPTGLEMEVHDQETEKVVSQRLRSIAQCYAIRALEYVPIIECGRRKDMTSLVNIFSRIPWQTQEKDVRSDAVNELIQGALRANAAHRKRLETAEASCVLGRLSGRKGKEATSLLQEMNLDLACEQCAAKLRGPLRGASRKGD